MWLGEGRKSTATQQKYRRDKSFSTDNSKREHGRGDRYSFQSNQQGSRKHGQILQYGAYTQFDRADKKDKNCTYDTAKKIKGAYFLSPTFFKIE